MLVSAINNHLGIDYKPQIIITNIHAYSMRNWDWVGCMEQEVIRVLSVPCNVPCNVKLSLQEFSAWL